MSLSASRILQALAQLVGRLLPTRWRGALQREPILVLVVPLVVAALTMRLNNAIRYPSMHGFDSYAHATYIWHLLLTGTVPVASDGWGRFHPPLYYALSAGIWSPLRTLEPSTVLKILNVIFSLVGLGSALVACAVARRYFGAEKSFAWAAPLFILFLPVHIYTAPMLGNEGLSTALCALASFFLVRLLETQRLSFAVMLGTTLGLAMLTKFTAIVLVGSSVVTILLWAVLTRRPKAAIAHLALVTACVLAISGWFYGRNVLLYSNPFQMSRNYFATKRIESTIPVGKRGLASYISFDTTIFKHPTYASGPVLDSVWTGVYATAWFDAHGGWFLPSAAFDAMMHHVGRILMVLGVIPTLVMLLGLATGLRRAITREHDPVLVSMLTTTACMVGMFVIYTFENRIYTAVKASYLLPAIVPFSFWFALGLRTVAGWGSLLFEGTLLALLALAGFVLPVYTYQLFFEVPTGPHYWNSIAVLEYLAGFRELARVKFQAATVFDGIDPYSNLYLAHENLSSLALEEGDPYLALAELRRARGLVPSQVFGQPEDLDRFIREIDAEYWNSLCVIYDRIGWTDLALESALNAVTRDPTLPEGHFDQGILMMKRADYEAAVVSFQSAVTLDPGFAEAQRMLAAAEARTGRCSDAAATLERIAHVGRLPRRTYPHAVGTGELHDAAIVRRRHIAEVPAQGDHEAAVAPCRDTQPRTDGGT